MHRSGRLTAALRRTFVALDAYNYRLFFAGNLVSYIGLWMQTMAEAWLVLTLTDSGVAVGATFAFRFLPVALFGLWGGVVADHFERRKVLLVTQSLMAVLAVVLWLLVLADVVQVWMVFALATALGFVTVVDEPARQAFVEEMVGRERLPNAIGLNSAVNNSARITGPAIAGIVIATAGVSWVFFVNALSFIAVVAALLAMRRGEMHPVHREHGRPQIRDGLRQAWSTVEMRSTILLVAVVGTLVYNFPTFLTLLAEDTFGGSAGLAGFLMAVLGVGTVLGALLAALRARPRQVTVIGAALFLGLALLSAAVLPAQWAVTLALLPVGAGATFFGTTANAHMQVTSPQHVRGRVMSIYMLLTLGSTVIGGPFVGWVCDQWNPRVGIGLAGAATASAAVVLSFARTRASARVADGGVLGELRPAVLGLDDADRS
jgi:MFS family permease